MLWHYSIFGWIDFSSLSFSFYAIFYVHTVVLGRNHPIILRCPCIIIGETKCIIIGDQSLVNADHVRSHFESGFTGSSFGEETSW